jgi:hypothetical protein
MNGSFLFEKLKSVLRDNDSKNIKECKVRMEIIIWAML